MFNSQCKGKVRFNLSNSFLFISFAFRFFVVKFSIFNMNTSLNIFSTSSWSIWTMKAPYENWGREQPANNKEHCAFLWASGQCICIWTVHALKERKTMYFLSRKTRLLRVVLTNDVFVSAQPRLLRGTSCLPTMYFNLDKNPRRRHQHFLGKLGSDRNWQVAQTTKEVQTIVGTFDL